MTTDDVMQALLREYPNGVSFDPMALRLVRQKMPIEDSQIEDLKARMFHMGDGLWFSREMISGNESLRVLEEHALNWITKHGCFSVERLFEDFPGALHHIATPDNLAALLRYQGFTVVAWGKSGLFCFLPPPSLNESLAKTSKAIAKRLEKADGMLAFHEVEEAMPHLTAEALSGIRVTFLPEVHEAGIGGLTCWRSAEAISLPEDFAEKLTNAVDTLVALGEIVSIKGLQFALNLFYRIRFREEYALQDDSTFMRVCAKHYQGSNDAFPNANRRRTRTSKSSMPGRRMRRPNTRFADLGVPIGAELVFTKDGRTTCIVLDDSNQVEFKGASFAISKLAMRLLGVSAPRNGFSHFSYEGETLWTRRGRMDREGKKPDNHSKGVLAAELSRAGSSIIGLEGNSLSPATWRSYRADGTNPRLAEWVRRVDAGESADQIAAEAGYAVSTLKVMMCNHRLYLKVCRLNGITPEAGADV